MRKNIKKPASALPVFRRLISPWLLRSGMVLVLMLLVAGSTMAAFNWGAIDSQIRSAADRTISAGQFGGGEIGDATDDPSTLFKGSGFYMTIYKDTVQSPNQLVEEQIKERFGIEMKVDVLPPAQQGKYMFTDFFKNPTAYHGTVSAPLLTDNLQSDCVRMKAGEADDERRKWAILKRRLGQRAAFVTSQPASEEQVNREVLLRLSGLIDQESQRQLDAALANIPEFRSLSGSQAYLLRCYEDLTRAVDFELKLQSILYPSRKKLEILQTFMNGRLDDFAKTIPGAGVAYGTSFPQYDLLFDIDVIDMIFFGTPVATNVGGPGDVSGEKRVSEDFQNYQQVADATEPSPSEASLGDSTSASGNTDPTSGPSSTGSEAETGTEAVASAPTTNTFGTKSSAFAGPLCVESRTGLNLRYAQPPSTVINPPAANVPVGSVSGGSQEGPVTSVPNLPQSVVEEVAEALGVESDVLSSEGAYQFGKNRKALCEGSLGVDFGNDFLKLFLCIDISFNKVGKTWQTTREDNCIACHITAMNRVFEELVFKSSVRPHKNTGTIMESGICEDGYGDDIGFFSFIEWVPVKFYDEICYPQGGVTDKKFAELVGYPEIVHRLNKPGFYVNCEADFKDEKAVERCKEAIGGVELDYDRFRQSYISTVTWPIKSTADLDKSSNLWARLVGDQGIAEREMHKFLYRMGMDQPWYGEEEVLKGSLMFKDRIAALRDTMRKIREKYPEKSVDRDPRVEQLLCLKGYFQGEQQPGKSKAFNCERYPDTFKKLEEDIAAERERVSKITERWNKRSADFNQENKCSVFSGSGPLKSFWDTFESRTSLDYYLETDTRRIQTPQQQVTGQIVANSDFEEIDRIFAEIDQQIQSIAQGKTQEELKREFESNQDRSLQLYSAFATELTNFQSTLRAYTNWWSQMVDDKAFVSKGGQRINVLQSFREKLR